MSSMFYYEQCIIIYSVCLTWHATQIHVTMSLVLCNMVLMGCLLLGFITLHMLLYTLVFVGISYGWFNFVFDRHTLNMHKHICDWLIFYACLALVWYIASWFLLAILLVIKHVHMIGCGVCFVVLLQDLGIGTYPYDWFDVVVFYITTFF